MISYKSDIKFYLKVFINYPCYGKEPKNFEKIEVKLKPKLYYIYLKSLPTYYIKSSAEGNKVETYIDIGK